MIIYKLYMSARQMLMKKQISIIKTSEKVKNLENTEQINIIKKDEIKKDEIKKDETKKNVNKYNPDLQEKINKMDIERKNVATSSLSLTEIAKLKKEHMNISTKENIDMKKFLNEKRERTDVGDNFNRNSKNQAQKNLLEGINNLKTQLEINNKKHPVKTAQEIKIDTKEYYKKVEKENNKNINNQNNVLNILKQFKEI